MLISQLLNHLSQASCAELLTSWYSKWSLPYYMGKNITCFWKFPRKWWVGKLHNQLTIPVDLSYLVSKMLFLQLKIHCSKIFWVGSYTFNKCQHYLTFIVYPQKFFHTFTWHSLSYAAHALTKCNICNWGVRLYTACTDHWSRSRSRRCTCFNVNMIIVAQISTITLLINKICHPVHYSNHRCVCVLLHKQ